MVQSHCECTVGHDDSRRNVYPCRVPPSQCNVYPAASPSPRCYVSPQNKFPPTRHNIKPCNVVANAQQDTTSQGVKSTLADSPPHSTTSPLQRLSP
mmetsp:Transcript_20024/g.40252  ORF Transcript_20024/g.40252 Transcript_20024/m.40252 type:complete len:96 (+) Transcript_20024:74-361(+)